MVKGSSGVSTFFRFSVSPPPLPYHSFTVVILDYACKSSTRLLRRSSPGGRKEGSRLLVAFGRRLRCLWKMCAGKHGTEKAHSPSPLATIPAGPPKATGDQSVQASAGMPRPCPVLRAKRWTLCLGGGGKGGPAVDVSDGIAPDCLGGAVSTLEVQGVQAPLPPPIQESCSSLSADVQSGLQAGAVGLPAPSPCLRIEIG